MKKVTDVKAYDDLTLELVFDDGSVRHFDAKPYLEFPAFRHLKSPAEFVRASVQHDTVSWPGGQDISPDTLYLESVQIGEVVTA
ncbi:MAG: DUF2442 domain-containing protein [Pyrinomonadaceae bacterium]